MLQRTKDAIAKRICTKCFKNPAAENRKMCQVCLDKDKERSKTKRVLSPEHIKAMAEGRKRAFALRDTQPKRHYTKRVDIDVVRMQGMVNELEAFIGSLGRIPASDYLEARTNLIKSIILRAKA